MGLTLGLPAAPPTTKTLAGGTGATYGRGMLRTILTAALAVMLAQTPAQAAPRDARLVLVTLDGVPWTEVFKGADPTRAADRAFVAEMALTKKDFLDPPDRARALAPFLNDVMAR